jgi:hypothetical protein
LSGISRPRAFAVLRLITSSYMQFPEIRCLRLSRPAIEVVPISSAHLVASGCIQGQPSSCTCHY